MVQGTILGWRLLQAYLLFMAVVLVPVALTYGIDPAGVLPRLLEMKVEGVDQIHIFRALMCLYLGASTFWAVAAFKPDWQRVATIWAIFFCFSLVLGRVISLIVDGTPSLLLDFYLAMEISGGLLGLAVLAYVRKSAG
jgi:uncharacterized protein DUF4345